MRPMNVRQLKWVTTAALVLLGGMTASLAQAQEQKPSCPDIIEFGNISDGLGTANRNINSDLVMLLQERSGCTFRVLSMPAKRVMLELEEGKLHMSGRFFQTPEREAYLWFAHVQRTKVRAWFRRDRVSASQVLEFPQSRNMLVGITAGFTHSKMIDGIVTEMRRERPHQVIEFPDRKALYRGLLQGRVDVVFLPAAVIEELSETEGEDAKLLDSVDFAPDERGAEGGIVLAKKRFDQAEAEKWQRLIYGLCTDGSILRVFRKYFDATEEDLACSSSPE